MPHMGLGGPVVFALTPSPCHYFRCVILSAAKDPSCVPISRAAAEAPQSAARSSLPLHAAGRVIYNPAVRKLRTKSMFMLKMLAVDALLCGVLAASALAQEAPSTSADAPQTQIQVNFLNTCSPAAANLEAMGRALASVKETPSFSSDFEISRGLKIGRAHV